MATVADGCVSTRLCMMHPGRSDAAAGDGVRVGGAAYPSQPPADWPAWVPASPRPAAAPGSQSPPPTPPSSSRGPILAVLAVVAVVLLGAVGVGVLVSRVDDDTAGGPPSTVDLDDPAITAPPSEEPVDPALPSIPGLDPGPPIAVPEERARPLEEVLPEIIDFVERTRGQEFVTDPVVQAVPDGEFVDLLREARTEDEIEALRDATVTDVALGLVQPGTDLVDVLDAAGEVSVLGFYRPDTEELYVKGDAITPLVQTTIAHELTHALDDQIFDLGRIDALAERDTEEAFAFLALVEGTASFVGDAYRAQLSPEDAAAADDEELALGFQQLPGLIEVPPAFLVEQQIPYASGQRFVDALLADGGTGALDAAYEAPPTTSEQVLDPEVFVAGEGAVALQPLEAPPAPAQVAEEVAFGAADLRLLELVGDPMGALLDPAIGVLDPVPGFGGGRMVSWEAAGEACVSIEAVGDDAAGSATIEDLLTAWAGAAPGAEVSSRPGGTGVEVITATRCV